MPKVQAKGGAKKVLYSKQPSLSKPKALKAGNKLNPPSKPRALKAGNKLNSQAKPKALKADNTPKVKSVSKVTVKTLRRYGKG